MQENQIRLNFPMPISINIAYTGTTKRVKSSKYREWYEKCKIAYLNNEISYKLTGDKWLHVEYTFNFPLFNKNGTKKIKDLGNYEKILSDFLCDMIEGLEDHKFKTIILNKVDSIANTVDIKITEL